jgi:hypothetical protein
VTAPRQIHPPLARKLPAPELTSDWARMDSPLYLTPQNIAEFWNVCTRPIEVNGLGLSVELTDRDTNQLEQFFVILPDATEVFR